MGKAAVVDTSFLICLVDRKRSAHAAAKAYYKHFLENDVAMLLPTVVAAEFAIKQPITDLPLRNFRVLPFNLKDATRCAELNVSYYRKIMDQVGQRDAVKDDFKIIAQAVEQQAQFLVTEDDDTLKKYSDRLGLDGKLGFRLVRLTLGFDVGQVNEDGQRELPLPG